MLFFSVQSILSFYTNEYKNMKDKYLFLSIGFWGSRNSRWKGALQCLPWKLNKIKGFKAFLFAFSNGHQGNFWFLEGHKVYFLETSKAVSALDFFRGTFYRDDG